MPIYEYECQSCGHQLEAIQKISDAPRTDCPQCQKPDLKKQISAPGFRLSGGGWYETDFKTGTKKNLVEKDGGAAKSSGADSSPAKSSSSDSSSAKSSGSTSA